MNDSPNRRAPSVSCIATLNGKRLTDNLRRWGYETDLIHPDPESLRRLHGISADLLLVSCGPHDSECFALLDALNDIPEAPPVLLAAADDSVALRAAETGVDSFVMIDPAGENLHILRESVQLLAGPPPLPTDASILAEERELLEDYELSPDFIAELRREAVATLPPHLDRLEEALDVGDLPAAAAAAHKLAGESVSMLANGIAEQARLLEAAAVREDVSGCMKIHRALRPAVQAFLRHTREKLEAFIGE